MESHIEQPHSLYISLRTQPGFCTKSSVSQKEARYYQVCLPILHAKVYPTIQCFRIPTYTQSMIAYMILTW